MARASGIPYDLRKIYNYEDYNDFQFSIPTGSKGDTFDRFLIRMLEMRESIKIIQQLCEAMLPGPVLLPLTKFVPPSRANSKFFMESLISHFKYFSNGFQIPDSMLYTSVEAPKGEFGTLLITQHHDTKPFRCYIRAPGFFHLAALNKISQNHSLADVVAIMEHSTSFLAKWTVNNARKNKKPFSPCPSRPLLLLQPPNYTLSIKQKPNFPLNAFSLWLVLPSIICSCEP